MSECSCDVLLGNQGVPGCVPVHGVAKRLWQVALKADDGTEFSIDPASLPNDAAIVALINQADRSKAVYPSALFETLTQTNADAVTEEFDSGAIEFVREGIRSVEGIVTSNGKASPALVGQMKANRCTTFGVYLITEDNKLVGRSKGDGLLYPFPVQSGSWIPQFVPATDTTTAKVQLNFNFTTIFRDEHIDFVQFDEATIDLLGYGGLLDVVLTATNPTTSSADINAVTIYGAANARRPVVGLGAGDVTLFNNTTSSSVVVSSFDPVVGSDGDYDLTFPAQTASDSLTLTIAKDGLDADTVTFTV